ncbi:hypothetical protein L6452_01678 [Arctium lappa]|uniref:Uncharacterized protein n=1 Tax=Arctium lappa TaxID=4217 RepID=A0ACB9FHJ4_ARCLA|nr:hypothetical protein L6452_01678 [Arctium lappa]
MFSKQTTFRILSQGVIKPEEKSAVERSALVENSDSTEAKSAAYWTTLAPNVKDYSGFVARMIASGSSQLIKGILWCGDVTVDRLKWEMTIRLLITSAWEDRLLPYFIFCPIATIYLASRTDPGQNHRRQPSPTPVKSFVQPSPSPVKSFVLKTYQMVNDPSLDDFIQ